MRSAGVLALLPTAALAFLDDPWPSSVSAPLLLLPQDAGDESPACLDGSPYGFYFRPSSSASTRWTIDIQGGGWCYDEDDCFIRSKTQLGSSTQWVKEFKCECKNPLEDGSIDEDCNCIFMPYGDGASFSGFRGKPLSVSDKDGNEQGQLFFRGLKNLDAAMDFALAHGLGKATEFVLTGVSAGGLSTFLHVDRFAKRLEELGAATKVRAAPIVGYFLDHADLSHDSRNYTEHMRYVYHMQNLTSGPDGALKRECLAAFPDSPHYCFMSPHMQQFIRTPYFMFNSKYDAWQLQNELLIDAPYQYTEVVQYGKDFMQQFGKVGENPQHGAMITSCVCHNCLLYRLVLEGKDFTGHFADWYYGKTTGEVSIHVDTRGPNGDGELGPYHGCEEVQEPPAKQPPVQQLPVQVESMPTKIAGANAANAVACALGGNCETKYEVKTPLTTSTTNFPLLGAVAAAFFAGGLFVARALPRGRGFAPVEQSLSEQGDEA